MILGTDDLLGEERRKNYLEYMQLPGSLGRMNQMSEKLWTKVDWGATNCTFFTVTGLI